jgi:hypothetical protein
MSKYGENAGTNDIFKPTFYYSIQTKIFRNEGNLIERFELAKILNSSKFINYLIQTHS